MSGNHGPVTLDVFTRPFLRVRTRKTFQEIGRQIVREHLIAHPGATKDRIYDDLVSRMVSRGEMEAHDFEALLNSVAEEVQEPVRENLFENKKPDLWLSRRQSVVLEGDG